MAYKDRYGITKIRKDRRDNLSIGWDNFVNSAKTFDLPKNAKNRIPVFLFTPDMEDTNNHHHIMLNKKQAEILRDWLNAYLKDVGAKKNV